MEFRSPPPALRSCRSRMSSGDLTDEWIGAGIAETVSANFSRLGMSSVVGAALVDGPNDDGLSLLGDAQARRVARDLGMAWVITGGFQRVGGALRVVARIVEVATGDIRRTVTLDGMADELFILQDRIVVELSAGFDLLVESNDQPRAAVFAQPRPPGGTALACGVAAGWQDDRSCSHPRRGNGRVGAGRKRPRQRCRPDRSGAAGCDRDVTRRRHPTHRRVGRAGRLRAGRPRARTPTC